MARTTIIIKIIIILCVVCLFAEQASYRHIYLLSLCIYGWFLNFCMNVFDINIADVRNDNSRPRPHSAIGLVAVSTSYTYNTKNNNIYIVVLMLCKLVVCVCVYIEK